MDKSSSLALYRSRAAERIDIERQFLRLLAHGNTSVLLTNPDLNTSSEGLAHYLSTDGNLERYALLNDWQLDSEYSVLPAEAKYFFHAIKAMERFQQRGWIESKYLMTHCDAPEDGPADLWNKLEGTQANSTAWLAIALCSKASQSQRICSREHPVQPDYSIELTRLEYRLTTSGFKQALALENAEQEQIRFDTQLTMNKHSLNTARAAVFMAFVIAVGSITNACIQWKYYDEKLSQQSAPANESQVSRPEAKTLSDN